MKRKRVITEYMIDDLEIEGDACAGHHFARVTLSAARRVEDLDEHTTTYFQEDIIGEGVCKRTSGDHNDEYVGQYLALGRALEALSVKVLRRTKGKVKHNDDMKLQRAHKREYADYFKGIVPVPVESVDVKNLRTIGKAYEAMFGDEKTVVDMVVCDDLESLEDTHFEDDGETERLIDEC